MSINFLPVVGSKSPHTVLTADFDTTVWGADAQEIWRALREAGSIACPNPDMVVTTSTKAVDEALHNPGVFSSNPEAGYFGSETGAIPLQIDPPYHSRFRKLLDPLFTPRKMAAREDEVVKMVNDRIDGFIDRGTVDFCSEFAVPFPSEMFLRVMGLPLENLDEFLIIKEQMIRPEGADEAARRGVQEQAGGWIFNYISGALAEREREMTDDVLGTFVQLERDGRLTRDETLNICLLFIPAGLDTVTDTLECSFAYLSQHPDHQRQLAEDPDLCGHAVEELLRYESPVPSLSRIAMTDTSLDGCPVAKSQQVRALLAIANHDPELFPDPERVEFERSPNRHIAFGAGVHRCVGSHLARLELRVALREWHRRIPTYQLQPGYEIVYQRGLREIEHLPLEFPPGGGKR